LLRARTAALRYAGARAFGKTISGFQAIQWKLADNATRIEAARLLTYRAAFLKTRAWAPPLESSMAKLYASEIAVRPQTTAVQIHGGYGLVKDYPAEKFFRDVKLTTIGEGTRRDSTARDRAAAADAMIAAERASS
jgi:alkylation response protein AidB-like acyl-CoA dehydrogenase